MEFASYVVNERLREWIEEMVTLCKPARMHFCDGSPEEYDALW